MSVAVLFCFLNSVWDNSLWTKCFSKMRCFSTFLEMLKMTSSSCTSSWELLIQDPNLDPRKEEFCFYFWFYCRFWALAQRRKESHLLLLYRFPILESGVPPARAPHRPHRLRFQVQLALPPSRRSAVRLHHYCARLNDLPSVSDNMAFLTGRPYPLLSLTVHPPLCRANWPQCLPFRPLIAFGMAQPRSMRRSFRFPPLSRPVSFLLPPPCAYSLPLLPQGLRCHLPVAQGVSVSALLAFGARLTLHCGTVRWIVVQLAASLTLTRQVPVALLSRSGQPQLSSDSVKWSAGGLRGELPPLENLWLWV